MVEIEKYFKIEIEIYRIEIFRTEIEIGFYRIGFLRFCFRFRYNFGISKNYDSIYFDTKFNRCYFDKYQIVSVLHRNIEMTPVSVAFKKLRVFSLRNLGFRPIFYGTGSVQGFPHLGFRSIFI